MTLDRKLQIAVDALKHYADRPLWDTTCRQDGFVTMECKPNEFPWDTAQNALDKIKETK